MPVLAVDAPSVPELPPTARDDEVEPVIFDVRPVPPVAVVGN